MQKTYAELLQEARDSGDMEQYKELKAELKSRVQGNKLARAVDATKSADTAFHTVSAYTMSALDSALLGFGGEVAAPVQTAWDKLTGNKKPWRELYRENEKNFDTIVANQRKKDPWATMVTDTAAGFGLGGVGTAVAKTGGVAGRIARHPAVARILGTDQVMSKAGSSVGARAGMAGQVGATQAAITQLGEADTLDALGTGKFWQDAALDIVVGGLVSSGAGTAIEGLGRGGQAIVERVSGVRATKKAERAYNEFISSPEFATTRADLLNSLRNDLGMAPTTTASDINRALVQRNLRATGRTGAAVGESSPVGLSPTMDRQLLEAHQTVSGSTDWTGGLSDHTMNLINKIQGELKHANEEILYHVQGHSHVTLPEMTDVRAVFNPVTPMMGQHELLRDRWIDLSREWQAAYGSDSDVSGFIHDVIEEATKEVDYNQLRRVPVDEVFSRYQDNAEKVVSRKLFERAKDNDVVLSQQSPQQDYRFLRNVGEEYEAALGQQGQGAWKEYQDFVTMMLGLPQGTQWRGTPNQVRWLMQNHPDLAKPMTRLWHLRDMSDAAQVGSDSLMRMINATNPEHITQRVPGVQHNVLEDFSSVEDMATWVNFNIMRNEELAGALGQPGQGMTGGDVIDAAGVNRLKDTLNGWLGDGNHRTLTRKDGSPDVGALAYFKAARQMHGDLRAREADYQTGRQGFPQGSKGLDKTTDYNRTVDDLKMQLDSDDWRDRQSAQRRLHTIQLGAMDNAISLLRQGVKPLEVGEGKINIVKSMVQKDAIDRIVRTLPDQGTRGRAVDGLKLIQDVYRGKVAWEKAAAKGKPKNYLDQASAAISHGVTNLLQFIGETASGWMNLQRSGEAKRSLENALQIIKRQGLSERLAAHVQDLNGLQRYIQDLESTTILSGTPMAGRVGSMIGAQAGARWTANDNPDPQWGAQLKSGQIDSLVGAGGQSSYELPTGGGRPGAVMPNFSNYVE